MIGEAAAHVEKVETLLALPVPLTPDAVKNTLLSSALFELYALKQIAELRLQVGRLEQQVADIQRTHGTSRN
jgi:hypothetical protein